MLFGAKYQGRALALPATPPWQGPGPHPVPAYIQHMTYKVLMLVKVIFSQPAISIVGRQGRRSLQGPGTG